MSNSIAIIDALESRTLLTAVPSPLVAADTAQYKLDVAKMQADVTANANTLKTDKVAVDAATKAINAKADPLKAKLKLDQTTWTNLLKADSAAISAAEAEGHKVVVADQLQITKDKGKADALRADNAKLDSDRAASNAKMDPLRAKFATDTAAMNAAVAADQAAINDLSTTSDALTAAKAKLDADQKAADALIKADQAIIKSDQEKITRDSKITGGDTKTK